MASEATEGSGRGEPFFGSEFVSGSIAGACGVFFGHPLDTIKTRLQTTTSGHASSVQCAVDMTRREGFRSFYRGLSWPLLSKSVEQCLIFGLNEKAKRFVPLEGDALVVASGALAGLIGMGILTPVYVVKVQLQLPPKERVAAFRGPLHCAQFNLKKFGVRGLYAGLLPSVVANPICYGVRFLTYGKAQEAVGAIGVDNAAAAQLIGGGISGMATWASAYPLDVVMSKMQAQGAQVRFQEGSPRGMAWHVAEMYRSGGVRSFFKGIGPCLLRAFPVNAVIFLVYEQVMSWL